MRRFSILGFLLLACSLVAVTACPSSEEKANEEHGEHEAEERGEHAEHGEHEEPEGAREHDEGIVELRPEAAAQINIRVEPVEERHVSVVLSTTGRVDFDQDQLAHVSPRISGRIHKVLGTLGQQVKAGDALAVIDSIELGQAKSAFLQAKAQLNLARRTLEREEGLLADRISSEQAVLEVRATYEQALADFQAARQRLALIGLSKREINAVRYEAKDAALFTLRSPIDGTVMEKHINLGEIVSPNTNLYTIADLGKLWIWIDVYERDLGGVHLGDDVSLKVDTYPDQTFVGKVTYVRDQVDADTRTARARIDVDNSDGRLKPGMFASVTVTDPHGREGREAPRVLAVPASAVQRDGDSFVAFVRIGDNRYERRVLRIGRRTDTYVEVLDGLSAGESVAITSVFILKSEAAKESMGGGHEH